MTKLHFEIAPSSLMHAVGITPLNIYYFDASSYYSSGFHLCAVTTAALFPVFQCGTSWTSYNPINKSAVGSNLVTHWPCNWST
jgi:hypothetical protein